MVGVTLALLSLVTVTVFDIGGNTSDTPDASLQVEKQGDEVVVNVLKNKNVKSIKVSGPSGNQKIISNPNAGSSVSISDGIGNYNIIGVMSDGKEQVIRTTELDLNLETSTTSGTLSINPNIPNADIVSKDQNGRIIDKDKTDTNGDFTVETVSEGSVMANVEGFDQYSTMTNINNDLYSSKEVKTSSVESNSGIEFTVDGGDVVTLTNSSGDKVDVLYESKNGATQIGNPWQLEASNNDKINDRELELINGIDADKESFKSFNDGNAISSHPDVTKGGNKIKDKSKLSELTVTWIDVGQADSILINAKGGDKMVIDTGDRFDDAKNTIHYINKKGINKIDHLVASHQDSDHIGGHENFINTLGSSRLGNIYDNGVPRSTQTAQDYVNAVSNQGLSITEVERGDNIPFDGAKVEVLNPKNIGDSGEDGSKNDVVVLKLTHGDNKMFFGGDVESESESEIVDAYSGNLNIDVMDVPHHGSSTSSSDKLLNELTPKTAIVSAPYDSQFGHPDDQVINRYESRNIDLLWTAANGNITIESDGTNIEKSFEKGELNDVTKDSSYDISVQSIKSSVEQGSTVNVDYKITNTGNIPDIQDIKLNVENQNNPVDENEEIKLSESESVSKTLSWTTSSDQNPQDYTVTVSTEDDSVDNTVSITGTNDGSNGESSTVNLLNPSFEDGSGADATNWIETDTANSGRTNSFNSFSAHDGSYAIVMNDLTGSYSGRVAESSKFDVSAGNNYNFGAYYYLPETESPDKTTNYRQKIELRWFDGDGNTVGSDAQDTGDISTYDSWTKVSVSGEAPSGSTKAKILISAKEDNNKNGNIYWDSVFINN